MRWAIGAIAAVLSTMVILPGVASAHHFTYDETILCDDGSFDASITYVGGENNVIITVSVEGQNYTGQATTGGVATTTSSNVTVADTTNNDDFNFSPARDRFEVDGHPNDTEEGFDETDSAPDFLTVSGDYDNVNATADGEIDISASMYNGGGPTNVNDTYLDDVPPGGQLNANQGEAGLSLERTVSLSDFSRCITELCIDGEFDDILEFQGEDTNDCGKVTVCLGDNTGVMSEFEQEQQNLGEGECATPPPPPTTPPPTVTTPPPVQQVAAAVSEVLPARLPSTGTGPSESSSSFSLVAALAVGLLSIGGVATLIARRSRS